MVGGQLTRPMITQVVEVDTEHHGGAAGGSDRRDHIHQFGLAVVATVGVVDPVRGALHLVGDDRGPAKAPLGGERAAVGLFIAGERRRYGRHRMGVIGEHLVSDSGKECTVGSPAERHDDPAEAAQFDLQRVDLVVEQTGGHPADASGRDAGSRRRQFRREVGT